MLNSKERQNYLDGLNDMSLKQLNAEREKLLTVMIHSVVSTVIIYIVFILVYPKEPAVSFMTGFVIAILLYVFLQCFKLKDIYLAIKLKKNNQQQPPPPKQNFDDFPPDDQLPT